MSHDTRTAMQHLMRCLFAIGIGLVAGALLGALTGCGGGDPDSHKTVDPPLCETNPELCR